MELDGDKLGTILLNMSKREGSFHDFHNQEDFVKSIYNGTGQQIPALNETYIEKPTTPWRELRTGDIAVYSNGSISIIGIVAGTFERQFCYIDPHTSIVRIDEYDEYINDCAYVSGVKVMSVGE